MKVNRIIHGVLLVLGLSVVGLLLLIDVTCEGQKLSTYFLGKMRIHMTAAPDEEIIVSKDKVATVKRWLDS